MQPVSLPETLGLLSAAVLSRLSGISMERRPLCLSWWEGTRLKTEQTTAYMTLAVHLFGRDAAEALT